MICKKCSGEIEADKNYCSYCGFSTNEKKRKRKTFFNIFKFLFAILVFLAIFIFGILIGGEYGIKTDVVSIEKISFMTEFSKAIKAITSLPFTIAFTENQINKVIEEEKDSFLPMENIYMRFSEGVCTFSGQIQSAQIKTFIKADFPDFVYMFFPDILNIKAELVIDDSNPTKPVISSVSILNIDNSDEILKSLKLNNAIEKLVQNQILNNLPKYITITKIEIQEEKLSLSGNIAIIE